MCIGPNLHGLSTGQLSGGKGKGSLGCAGGILPVENPAVTRIFPKEIFAAPNLTGGCHENLAKSVAAALWLIESMHSTDRECFIDWLDILIGQ